MKLGNMPESAGGEVLRCNRAILFYFASFYLCSRKGFYTRQPEIDHHDRVGICCNVVGALGVVEASELSMAKTFRTDTFVGPEIPLHVVEWEVIQVVVSASCAAANAAGMLGLCVN